MRTIWYLLTCPEGEEADYMEKCTNLAAPGKMEKMVCFQYQCMIRYGGQWHVENRTALPGCVFLAGAGAALLRRGGQKADGTRQDIFLTPCDPPYLMELCLDGALIGISKGIIKNGGPVVTSGPLRGREGLIRRIDRHKRTAWIEIPLNGGKRQVTVGLEIYEKEI